jgi:cytoskeletal protein CcmA (bactofilin family)
MSTSAIADSTFADNSLHSPSGAPIGPVPGRILTLSSMPAIRAHAAAVIGPTLVIRGEVSGAEPLLVEGRIEGPVSIPGGYVSVGREGVLTSIVTASEVVVRGTVLGNIHASDRVEICKGGSLTGDIVTRRVSIQDGAYITGSILTEGPDPKSA